MTPCCPYEGGGGGGSVLGAFDLKHLIVFFSEVSKIEDYFYFVALLESCIKVLLFLSELKHTKTYLLITQFFTFGAYRGILL